MGTTKNPERRTDPRSVGRMTRRALAAVTLGLLIGGPGTVTEGDGAGPAPITALAVVPPRDTLWVGTARGLFRGDAPGASLVPVPLPGGEAPAGVTALAVDPRTPSTLYVATGGAGIFKSETGGASWAPASSGLTGLDIRGLAVSPTDGRLHAQATGKGMFRSGAGRGWLWVDAGPPGVMHALASVNIPTGMGGIFLYAATDHGLLRGADCF